MVKEILILVGIIIFIVGLILLRNPNLVSCDPVSCALSSGTCEQAGMEHQYGCIHHFPDDGKVCKTSKECLSGLCYVAVGQRTATRGNCAGTDVQFGCFRKIEEKTEMCFD